MTSHVIACRDKEAEDGVLWEEGGDEDGEEKGREGGIEDQFPSQYSVKSIHIAQLQKNAQRTSGRFLSPSRRKDLTFGAIESLLERFGRYTVY